MKAELLFLHRYKQMSLLTGSLDEVDLLDLSQRLYQMIVDKHSLMDTANTRRIPLRFRATAQPPPPAWILDMSAFVSVEDSVDPDVVVGKPMAAYVREMTRDEFLALQVVWIEGKPLTVKHIIGYARNVAGGGHHDPTTQYGEYRALGEQREKIRFGGLPQGVRQLRAIGRIVVRGLLPLYDDITACGLEQSS